MVDVFSPSNIPWLNPEVIAATANTGGRNFVAGTVNMLNDLRQVLSGSVTEPGGFQVGRDLAAKLDE